MPGLHVETMHMNEGLALPTQSFAAAVASMPLEVLPNTLAIKAAGDHVLHLL